MAQAIAGTLQWPLVDKDDAKDAMHVLAAQIDPAQLNDLSYDVMWRMAERQLACGNSVIVDSPLARRELYDTACALAGKVQCVTIGYFKLTFADILCHSWCCTMPPPLEHQFKFEQT